MLRSLFLLFAALAAGLATPAAAAPAAKESMKLSLEGFVGDNAGVFSAAFIEEIRERLTAIHKRGEITVMVVTTPALGGADTATVANGIGKMMQQSGKTNRDWVVLLLAPVDREMSISFSSNDPDAAKALKSMDDASREQVLQELGAALDAAMTPFLKAGDWEGGIHAGVDAIEGRLAPDSPPSPLGPGGAS
jgi:uncharacterized membrane protein YgcG